MKDRHAEKFLHKKRRPSNLKDKFDYFEHLKNEEASVQLKRIAGSTCEKDTRPLKVRLIDLAASNPEQLMTAVWNAGFFIKMVSNKHFNVLVRAN